MRQHYHNGAWNETVQCTKGHLWWYGLWLRQVALATSRLWSMNHGQLDCVNWISFSSLIVITALLQFKRKAWQLYSLLSLFVTCISFMLTSFVVTVNVMPLNPYFRLGRISQKWVAKYSEFHSMDGVKWLLFRLPTLDKILYCAPPCINKICIYIHSVRALYLIKYWIKPNALIFVENDPYSDAIFRSRQNVISCLPLLK